MATVLTNISRSLAGLASQFQLIEAVASEGTEAHLRVGSALRDGPGLPEVDPGQLGI